MVIYASEQVHMSIPKAADILGIGRDHVRLVATDELFKVSTEKLREAIRADLQKGFRPFCVVANAGTVNTGAVDRLEGVADIADEFDLWFHVDGAYGAPGALDPRKRSLFAGLERADSVSLDPHKWFYTPIDCGCLMFRDPERARAAFSSGEVDYIKVHEHSDTETFAFWDYGVELSRRFRALKLWFTLKYYGVQRLAAAIAEDNELAQYLGARVEAADDFELLAPIELSICCFRYVPAALRQRLAAVSGDEAEQLNVSLDDLNARIMHTVQRGGRAYFSSATLRGRFALRVCIVNFRTTRLDLDQTLEIIRETAKTLDDLR